MASLTTLVKDGRMVVVPDVLVVTPDLLLSILRSAGISYTELVAALNTPAPRTGVFRKLDDGPPSSAGGSEP